MASTYLSRSVTTTGNQRTWTFSAWVKRSKLGTTQFLISAKNVGETTLHFRSQDDLQLELYDGNNYYIRTNRLFRDTNAWYHIVAIWDSIRPTASDRMRLYVNGVQETSFSVAVYPPQNYDSYMNQSGETNYIGNYGGSSSPFDGSMSHIHLIDGNDYNASYFGEYDANGVWKIITEPSVTYGTNGFFILKDGNSVTDQSGNGNNFTVAGGTLTNTEDSPSNVFNVLNAVSNPPNGYTLSNGNTRATQTGSSFQRFYIANTIAPTSGKWYWESKLITSGGSDRTSIGICSYDENIGTGTTEPNNELSIVTGISRIRIRENGSTTEVDSFYTVPSANDIFMYALDLDNTKFYFGVNGNWWNYNTAETGGDPTSGSGYVTNSTNIIKNAMSAFLRIDAGAVSTTFTNEFNFGNGYFGTTAVSSAGTNASGNGIFEYDVPSGYTALSTRGLNL